MISIGTGGIYGKGFNHLDLNVPVRESDMIFTVIAEDFGLVGGGLVLLTYLFLIYRMLRVTFKSNNRFYTFISTGLIMMIVFHIFENIGAASRNSSSDRYSFAFYFSRWIFTHLKLDWCWLSAFHGLPYQPQRRK